MTEQTSNSMLRRYVDGELTPPEAQAFERRLETDASLADAVAFERQLRESVGRTLQQAAAPEGLAERISDALRAVDLQAGSPSASHAESQPESQTDTVAEDDPYAPAGVLTLARTNWFMVAASLVLVTGAILVGIFGPTIDQRMNAANEVEAADLVAETAAWASEQHGRCVIGDGEAALPVQDRVSAAKAFARVLNLTDLQLPDLTTDFGYEFRAARTCPDRPCSEPVVHVVYQRAATHPNGPAMVSIFIVPDVGQFDGGLPDGMESGEWYESDGGPRCAHQVRRARDADIVFFLVCCDEQDIEPVSDQIIKGLRATD